MGFSPRVPGAARGVSLEIRYASKKHAISKGRVTCLGDVATLNVTRGCAGSCVFCYARCYHTAPPPGTVMVYSDLPQLLRTQLDSSRRRAALPRFVLLSTASDAFLGGEAVVRQVTLPCLEILLNRGIGVSLSTRGQVPDEAIALLAQHAPRVRIFIPLASMDEDYTRQWEPGTALPRERLYLAQRLLREGIRPVFRIEPLIPFINDHSEAVQRVLSAVASLRLRRVILNYLHLRPGVDKQLLREAPGELKHLVLGGFPGLYREPYRYLRLARQQRGSALERIKKIAAQKELKVQACLCHNSDLAAGLCPWEPPELPPLPAEQAGLFAPRPEEQGAPGGEQEAPAPAEPAGDAGAEEAAGGAPAGELPLDPEEEETGQINLFSARTRHRPPADSPPPPAKPKPPPGQVKLFDEEGE